MNRDSSENEELDCFYEDIAKRATATGYNLNPDRMFTDELLRGLLENQERYGYDSCPCRLSSGLEEEDLDITCPCYYRDQDLAEFGACYCALYVSDEVANGKRTVTSIPERRPPAEERVQREQTGRIREGSLTYPVWRCRVCGYLCARDAPPDTCPICRAEKKRFERFI